MFVAMLTLYEDGGRPLGKWRHGGRREPTYGQAHFGQEWVDELNDRISVCTIQPGPEYETLHLYRSSLLHMASGELRITGLEYDVVNRKYSAQTWQMKALAPERPSQEAALAMIRDLVKSSGLRAAMLRPLVDRLEQEEGARA